MRTTAENTRRAEARKRVEEVKESGVLLTIPFAANNIRAAAKKAGAVWDRDRKQWFVPSDAARALLPSRRRSALPQRNQ